MPHGVKGAVKVLSYAENNEDIFKFKNIFDKNGNSVNLKKIGVLNGGMFISQFNDVNSRNDAENLRNVELYIKREELKNLNESEFYIEDLKNMDVFCEELVGKVKSIYNYGAGDILEIIWNNGKTNDIPFISDYVLNIDQNNKKIFVKIPEYI